MLMPALIERQTDHEGLPVAAFDVFASDRRQTRSGALFVGFEQTVTVTALFLSHLLEHLGGVGIAFLEFFTKDM